MFASLPKTGIRLQCNTCRYGPGATFFVAKIARRAAGFATVFVLALAVVGVAGMTTSQSPYGGDPMTLHT
jgi:hypothetical protein